jgi:Xanthomonas XOO_2897-like deaminase
MWSDSGGQSDKGRGKSARNPIKTYHEPLRVTPVPSTSRRKPIADELPGLGVQPGQVNRIYSELQPCSLPRHECGEMVRTTFQNARVTWSFEYGDFASRRRGIQALGDALQDLVGQQRLQW